MGPDWLGCPCVDRCPSERLTGPQGPGRIDETKRDEHERCMLEPYQSDEADQHEEPYPHGDSKVSRLFGAGAPDVEETDRHYHHAQDTKPGVACRRQAQERQESIGRSEKKCTNDEEVDAENKDAVSGSCHRFAHNRIGSGPQSSWNVGIY